MATMPDPPGKQHQLLGAANLPTDLLGRFVRGGAMTMPGQGVRFLLNMGSTMARAGLFTPSDFGLVAMLAPVSRFLGVFQALALSRATVQRQEVSLVVAL